MASRHHPSLPARSVPMAGLLIGTTLVLAAFTHRAEPTVRAERIELVGPTGTLQAVLTADSSGLLLSMLDKKGRPTSSLRLTPEPRIAVETGSGEVVAGLGAPKAHNLTH